VSLPFLLVLTIAPQSALNHTFIIVKFMIHFMQIAYNVDKSWLCGQEIEVNEML